MYGDCVGVVGGDVGVVCYDDECVVLICGGL